MTIDGSAAGTRRLDQVDAVQMMRSIRDRLSAEIEGMALEEELAWLASQEIDDPFLKRLRDRATKQPPKRSAAPGGR